MSRPGSSPAGPCRSGTVMPSRSVPVLAAGGRRISSDGFNGQWGLGGDRVPAHDPAKHGWYDPRPGRTEALQRQLGTDVEGSHPWLLQKASNHTGYGPGGRANGKVHGTVVSHDSPDWFSGARRIPGPFSTKTRPVFRCPELHITGHGPLEVRSKTYSRGAALDVIEKVHSSHYSAHPNM